MTLVGELAGYNGDALDAVTHAEVIVGDGLSNLVELDFASLQGVDWLAVSDEGEMPGLQLTFPGYRTRFWGWGLSPSGGEGG